MQTIDDRVGRLLIQIQMQLNREKNTLTLLGRHLNNLHPQRQFEQFKTAFKICQ